MQRAQPPVTSLSVAPAGDKVLEGWGLLCVLAAGLAALHVAKLALKGPGLH